MNPKDEAWPRFSRDPKSRYCANCRNLASQHPAMTLKCPNTFHYRDGEYTTTEDVGLRLAADR